MPRPEIIDQLFEARYEYETALFTDKAKARIRWRTISLEIIQQHNCTEEALQQVYADVIGNGSAKTNYRNRQKNKKLTPPRTMKSAAKLPRIPPDNAQARYVAELVKASRVKRPRKVEIECGRLLVTGSDVKAEYFKFVAAAASDRNPQI